MREATVAVIGGSGYVGSSLARSFVNDFRVRIVDLKRPRVGTDRVDFTKCDITVYDQVRDALEGVDLAIHTAIIQIPKINEEKTAGYEVNIRGTQNVCKAVDDSATVKGMLLAGSWHVFGERELKGVIDEEFGFRPDKVEERARLYALCKVAQESIVRLYNEISGKFYGVLRLGTVLGEGMPPMTAANIFITRSLAGDKITPYSHSMHRPMLLVDIEDVCRAFKTFATKILNGSARKGDVKSNIINLVWPKPVTILELARIIRDAVKRETAGQIIPEIEIVDTLSPKVFGSRDMNLIKVDVSRASSLLGIEKLHDPREVIARLVRVNLNADKQNLL